MNKIMSGNCLEKLKELEDNSVDSIVTDPPYHLVSIVKRFGKEGSAPAQTGKDGSFKRLSGGFMGKTWDGVDENGMGIAYNVELWKECLRVLKPGGHLLSFGGTRTHHRIMVAIEDAGFEIRDTICWAFGSGFPKSLNIGKAVDKLQGNEREEYTHKYASRRVSKINSNASHEYGFDTTKKTDTKGNSEWEGWGTALKPAVEYICMARKPLAEKTVAKNVLKYGTGGINIDESRVRTEDKLERVQGNNKDTSTPNAPNNGWVSEPQTLGRFPANLIHDNSEEVRECFPETKSGMMKQHIEGGQYNVYGKMYPRDVETIGDSGNASRFFKSIIYQAKASKSERGQGNNHPTVKPIALMEYLIKMVTPKGGVVLDPFTGSGTTGVAALQNGYKFIGIEKESEYIPIIEARLQSVNK